MAFTDANIEQRIKSFFPGEQGKQLAALFRQLNADILNLQAASEATAAKLNADAGVTDTDYVGATVETTGI